jgi:ATP-dependent Clp protease protease subunit
MFASNDRDRALDAVHARLFDQGVVLLSGDLDDECMGRVAGELMLLDATRDTAVKLWMNCGGGSLGAALALIDVIDLLGVPVHATCIGRAEGPPFGVLAVAARRAAIPHARLRLSAPSVVEAGRADDIAAASEQHATDVARFCARLSNATGRPTEWIKHAIDERRGFEATEAVRAGLIDEVAQSSLATISTMDRRPIGFQSRRRPR